MIRPFDRNQLGAVRDLSRSAKGRDHLAKMLESHRAGLDSLVTLIERGADTPSVLTERLAIETNIATLERALGTVAA